MPLIRAIDGRPLPAVPEKRENESAVEYAERLEWWKSRLPQDLLHAKVRGAVASEKGLLPWYEADTIGPTMETSPDGVPLTATHQRARHPNQQVWLQLAPKAPRRDPSQRLEHLAGLLVDGLKESFSETGKPQLSRSVIQQLVKVYADLGIKKTEQQVQFETMESLKAALIEYAKRLLNKAAAGKTIVLDPSVGRSPAVKAAAV